MMRVVRARFSHENNFSMSTPATPSSQPWWKDLTKYHWFVFAMACLAWMFDCLDQQLFILARNSAVAALSPPGANTPPISASAKAPG